MFYGTILTTWYTLIACFYDYLSKIIWPQSGKVYIVSVWCNSCRTYIKQTSLIPKLKIINNVVLKLSLGVFWVIYLQI